MLLIEKLLQRSVLRLDKIEARLKSIDSQQQTFIKTQKTEQNESKSKPNANNDDFTKLADKIVFTGKIDEYYNNQFGSLEYRSLKFDTKTLDQSNFQGNAVINYTESEIPYTRIIEHKHFEFGTQKKTVVTYEYPDEWSLGKESYYPVNDDKNNAIYNQYKSLSEKDTNVIFGGRLAEYKYYDMHQIIGSALKKSKDSL